MGYRDYLYDLLRPLGVYDLREESINGAELYAAGIALDRVAARLADAERECLTATAEGEGLSRREELFTDRPVNVSIPLRRAAIASLSRVAADDFTPDAINDTIRGSGVSAVCTETDTSGVLQVSFPNVVGVPDNYDQICKNIRSIVPCHLQTEFFLRYLTWEELEERELTWADIEENGTTWNELETAVIA